MAAYRLQQRSLMTPLWVHVSEAEPRLYCGVLLNGASASSSEYDDGRMQRARGGKAKSGPEIERWWRWLCYLEAMDGWVDGWPGHNIDQPVQNDGWDGTPFVVESINNNNTYPKYPFFSLIWSLSPRSYHLYSLSMSAECMDAYNYFWWKVMMITILATSQHLVL